MSVFYVKNDSDPNFLHGTWWRFARCRSIPYSWRLIGLTLLLVSCAADLDYTRIPIPDRRLNLSGLTAISTHYLNEHPDDFYTFHRILTAADDALGRDAVRTRAGVMRWLHRAIQAEGYDDRMPVYLFVRTVYLNGWERSWFGRIDGSDREYLFDLISAVMGGMHLCTTCSTAHEEPAPAHSLGPGQAQ